MFHLKKFSAKDNSTNINPTPTSPANSYGHIRTLKEDFEKFQAKERESSGEAKKGPEIPSQPPAAAPAQRLESSSETTPAQPVLNPTPAIRLSQKKSLPPEAKIGRGKLAPDTLGAETFFQTQSPFDEKTKISKAEPKTITPKSKRSLIVILSLIFLLAITSGGVYYWWFFIKLPQKEISSKTTPTEQLSDTTKDESQSLKQWRLDSAADKTANKLTFERYAKSLNTSADEEKAIEIKILSKDNQPISARKLEELLDFKLPASVSGKLTEDYSLFLTKENGEPRMGAAFKLNQALGLAESLKSEETTIFTNLKSFYLDKVPADTETFFNSSKYKNADIRYFNFPSPSNTSLDYTILFDRQNGYFIFSTSKNSIRAILDYMSEK